MGSPKWLSSGGDEDASLLSGQGLTLWRLLSTNVGPYYSLQESPESGFGKAPEIISHRTPKDNH